MTVKFGEYVNVTEQQLTLRGHEMATDERNCRDGRISCQLSGSHILLILILLLVSFILSIVRVGPPIEAMTIS